MAVLLVCAVQARASWYWPFGSGEAEPDVPRLSDLMEPASTNIEAAVDFAEDGKVAEAIDAYRRALSELDRVERENPERVNMPEFATLRNKRAYVTAAIDSLMLSQARANAKTVAVSDTTELERKLAEEKAPKDAKPAAVKKAEAEKPAAVEKPAERAEKPVEPRKPAAAAPAKPRSLRDRVIADIEKGDWAAADLGIRELLAARPNDAVALNLKASLEAEQGRLKDAESTLDQAIMSNPRSPHAYYNMADLMLRRDPPNAGAARRYYETGRAMGGPRAERLEALPR